VEPEEVEVEADGAAVTLEKHTFALLDGEGHEVANARNFPLSLAWASTIHKAQGATLREVLVDLSGLWEAGQAYVALSRARQAEDVHVSRWNARSIRSDPVVTQFYEHGCPWDFYRLPRRDYDDS
jgi:ATP-dependent DNA helicase PIF1